ncbi:MAG: hypothetical protein NZ899_02695 [Thermoguttaceae bacterium]|nr:hypothetical protein [Thermoguttaceae bacterium]MDW8079765.1 hypothetical protein [Thermoguttaceae bacterium]
MPEEGQIGLQIVRRDREVQLALVLLLLQAGCSSRWITEHFQISSSTIFRVN